MVEKGKIGYGEMIRAERKQMGMSQAAFGKQVGVSQGNVSDWENERVCLSKKSRVKVELLIGRMLPVRQPKPKKQKQSPKPNPITAEECQRCQTCRHIVTGKSLTFCNYLGDTDEMRGDPVSEHCSRYEKGKRKKR